jgi:hypothetical protein
MKECRTLRGLLSSTEIEIHGFAPVARGVSPLTGLNAHQTTVSRGRGENGWRTASRHALHHGVTPQELEHE